MYRDRRFGFELHITPMVKRLLIANGVAFVITMLIGETLVFDLFGLQPRRILVRPWGLFTYMFLHAGFWHLFMNMLVLFFFGPPLESRWGERQFLRFYVISGLGGAALSLLFMPGMVVGASAAIYGLMLAFALNWPNAPIYIYGVLPEVARQLSVRAGRRRHLWLVTEFDRPLRSSRGSARCFRLPEAGLAPGCGTGSLAPLRQWSHSAATCDRTP